MDSLSQDHALVEGAAVRILKGTCNGKSVKGVCGTISRITPKCVFVSINIDGVRKDVRKNKSKEFLEIIDVDLPPSNDVPVVSNSEDERRVACDDFKWSVPDADGGGITLGSRIATRMTVEQEHQPDTFLAQLFGNRMQIKELKLTATETSEPITTSYLLNGSRFELVSYKMKVETSFVSSTYRVKTKFAKLFYCQVEGPGLRRICVGSTLSDLADFSVLNPRMVLSRLELLQSPSLKLPNSKRAVFNIPSNMVQVVTDNGNDGCGFIAEWLMVELLSAGGKKYANDTLAIQVRVVVPREGVFKGVLMRKKNVEGAPIELQPSMRKVPASQADGDAHSEKACIIVTKAGRYPSPINSYIGRMLDPTLDDPPQSFQRLITPLNKKDKANEKKQLRSTNPRNPPKENRDMVPRLFQSVGLPKELCDDYVRKSAQVSGLNHAWVAGVADPTSALPAGHIFISGFSHVKLPNDEIFVTRSPCLKPSDARKVKMIVSRPKKMTAGDWEWLSALPFGVVMFANPKRGTQPLPVQIGNGDLDGDLYFICWNVQLLSHITTDPVHEVELEEEAVGDDDRRAFRGSWFEEAQRQLVRSIKYEVHLGALIGKLYELSQDAADASDDFMRDADAIAFADAFSQALDFKKHGRLIELDPRLRKHPDLMKFQDYFVQQE